MIHVDDVAHATRVRYVVARDTLETAVKAYAKLRTLAFTWEQDTTPDPTRDGVVIVSAPRVRVADIVTTDVQSAFGKFPEYEHLVPAKVSGELAQFNALYVADCAKARKLLGYDDAGIGYVFIAHNGTSGAYIRLGANALAVVMPMRGEPDTVLPEWFAPKQVATAKAA
jgi:hypothetical protein